MSETGSTNRGAADSDTPIPAPAVDLTGRTLGDFQVERLLGRGGMGEVYLARQASLDRPVALKVLRNELLARKDYLARFESEAWAAARLNHPNIVHIYTIGSVDGVRFIAMEYVAGYTLRDYINKKGAPELPLALSIMRQAGQAVGAAGEAGLVHRDIKPDNLLLTRKGQVKVADFGLVRAPEGDRPAVTQPGVSLGTPMYMSPEQVQGGAMDHRSDLYSLGVTFYHMLAGVPPFRAETGLALALKHVNDAPTSLAVHRPDLPPALVDLVMKLMAKRPPDRYQSAAEMLRDLARVRESVQSATGATKAATGAVSTASTASTEVSAVPAPTTERRRSGPGFRITPGMFVAAGLLGLVAGGALGWLGRAPDLLAAGSPAVGPPGLWLADWRQVPAQSSPEGQYRYAQTRADDSEREAAWLAVPGRFPASAEWASRAYVQLARLLLRRGDADNLEALAADLARTGRDSNQTLAAVARAGAAALRDDAQEAASRLSKLPIDALPPAHAELALEAVEHARLGRSVAVSDAQDLRLLRNKLLQALRIEFLVLLDQAS